MEYKVDQAAHQENQCVNICWWLWNFCEDYQLATLRIVINFFTYHIRVGLNWEKLFVVDLVSFDFTWKNLWFKKLDINFVIPFGISKLVISFANFSGLVFNNPQYLRHLVECMSSRMAQFNVFSSP